MVDRLGAHPVPVQLPIGAEDKFRGVVDLVRMKALVYKDETMGADYDVIDIPADMLEEANAYHEKLVEKASEADDKLLEKYLGGEPITEDELKAALRKRVIESVRKEAAPFVQETAVYAFFLGTQSLGMSSRSMRRARIALGFLPNRAPISFSLCLSLNISMSASSSASVQGLPTFGYVSRSFSNAVFSGFEAATSRGSRAPMARRKFFSSLSFSLGGKAANFLRTASEYARKCRSAAATLGCSCSALSLNPSRKRPSSVRTRS